ncbi:MAG: SGNH/GDSL hydrolase family protein [Fimbriimonadaceae bacterium]|nr:SGNH/GDSL hydrolase family protein [Fimbriimonadaceae bacterium]
MLGRLHTVGDTRPEVAGVAIDGVALSLTRLARAPENVAGTAPTVSTSATSSLTSALAYDTPNIAFDWPTSRLQDGGTYWRGSVLGASSYVAPFSVEFMLYGDRFEMFLGQQLNVSCHELYVDGLLVDSNYGAIASGNEYRKWVFASTALRRIKMRFYGVTYAHTRVDPTASVFLPPSSRPRVFFMGDSVTAGTGATNGSTLLGYAGHLARLFDADAYINGLPTTGFLNPGSTKTFVQRASTDLGSLEPDVVVTFGGYNDRLSVNGSYTGAALQAAVASYYGLVKAAFPNAKFLQVGVLPKNDSFNSSSDATDADSDVKTAALAAGVPFLSPLAGELYDAGGAKLYDEGRAWTYGTGKVGGTTGDGNADLLLASDGVHPTNAGHKVFALHIARAVATLFAPTARPPLS